MFKKGDKVIVFKRCETEGWPGGADTRKDSWVLEKTIVDYNFLQDNPALSYVFSPDGGSYTIPTDCLRLAKRKPTIIL